MARGFRPVDRSQQFLLPPDMREWLPSDHLVWFLIDSVETLDVSTLEAAYRMGGQGRAPLSPRMMLTLWLYACSQGVRSSREIERRCYLDVAFRVIAGGAQPDHSTIAEFRRRHELAMVDVFTQVVAMCAEAGLAALGVLAVDGSKISANAALGANRSPKKIREELERLLAEAAAVDDAEDAAFGDARGDELPEELADPVRRKAALRAAVERLAAREAAGEAEPKQLNVTDPDSQIMRGAGGQILQAFNAQIAVNDDGVIVDATVSCNANDLHELVGVVERSLERLDEVGAPAPSAVVADAGYMNATQIDALPDTAPVAVIATGPIKGASTVDHEAAERAAAEHEARVAAERERRRQLFEAIDAGTTTRGAVARELGVDWTTLIWGYTRWQATGEIPVRLPGAKPVVASRHRQLQDLMAARLADPVLGAAYKRRAPLAEGGFAGVKHRLGFRQFSRRGRHAADAELKLFATCHNLLKIRAVSLATA